VVDEFRLTSAPGVFAAGDIARWPDRPTGQRIRVEHWVVGEHYDTTIAYVGHAEQSDRLEVDGDPAMRDCAVGFWHGGRKLAVATVGRDRASLAAEVAFEQKMGHRASFDSVAEFPRYTAAQRPVRPTATMCSIRAPQ